MRTSIDVRDICADRCSYRAFSLAAELCRWKPWNDKHVLPAPAVKVHDIAISLHFQTNQKLHAAQDLMKRNGPARNIRLQGHRRTSVCGQKMVGWKACGLDEIILGAGRANVFPSDYFAVRARKRGISRAGFETTTNREDQGVDPWTRSGILSRYLPC